MMGSMEAQQRKEEWCRWLQAVLEEKLEGCGLRVEASYRPPVVKLVAGVEQEKDAEPATYEDTVGFYHIAIVCPLEWKVTVKVLEEKVAEEGEEALTEAALRMAEAVRLFNAVAWPDQMRDVRSYELWTAIPGTFEWITEQAPEILYRVTMQELYRRFGRRCVKEITLCEDLLVVHTRWAGNYCIGFDDFRRGLENAAGTIAGYMRKPIRNEYLKELRSGKESDKK